MSHPPPSSGPSPAPVEWDAIARHLADESSAQEAIAMRAWLAEHPDDAALVDALDRAVDRAVARTPADVDVEAALRRVTARRAASDPAPRLEVVRGGPPSAVPATSRVTRMWSAPALRAAAVLAVVVGGALVWRTTRGGDVARGAVLATAVGARDSLRLSDGTRVVVGPGSRLVVAADYGVERRDVTLEGEGYFVVQHDDARPFTVYAGGAAVRDVGTAFVVRAGVGRAGGVAPPGVHVTVTEGTVELRADRESSAGAGVLLYAGDVGALNADGRVVAERGAAQQDPLAWTRGQLVFRDTPLADVDAALRRWYGLELRVTDPSLAGRRLTAAFDQEPAGRVLDVIGLALGAQVERRGDTAFVRALPPPAPDAR